MIPNSSQIPNILLDRWMPRLSGSEFKVLLYLGRHTYGFGKDGDAISLQQIMHGIRKKNGEWLDWGTGLSKDTVCQALTKLEKLGIVERHQRASPRYGDLPTFYRINLNAPLPEENVPTPCPKKQTAGEPSQIRPGVSDDSNRGVSETREAPVSESSDPQNRESALQNQGNQKATAAKSRAVLQEPGLDAAADLVEALVAHSLNRCDAIRLAQEKPDQCAQQLAYLPYKIMEIGGEQNFRSGVGAYLRSAIEGEYSPPKRFLQNQAKQAQVQQRTEKKRLAQARAHHQERFTDAYQTYLQEAEALLSLDEPEQYAAFVESERQGRDRLRRAIHRPGSPIEQKALEGFDTVEAHRKRLLAFFRTALLPDFWQWDAQYNPYRWELTPEEATHDAC